MANTNEEYEYMIVDGEIVDGWIRELKQPATPKRMYLESHHYYNFRHGQENPRILSFELFTPEGSEPRPCFKVLYESDGTIDYIAYSEVANGNHKIIY